MLLGVPEMPWCRKEEEEKRWILDVGCLLDGISKYESMIGSGRGAAS